MCVKLSLTTELLQIAQTQLRAGKADMVEWPEFWTLIDQEHLDSCLSSAMKLMR